MPRKKEDTKQGIKEKLEYLGLDLNNIPKEITNYHPLEFRIPKFYDEKQYRQYRYIPIKNIQILLSPTNRLDEIEEKYKKAKPLAEYLDSESEENILNYTTFLNMLNQFKISEVEKIGQEQIKLNKKIPFKVKYQYNYLWQIYYSENTDQYFMLVPTEDSDYSTFFFLLKKQIERKRTGKIFVPIRNVGYNEQYLRRLEFEDIENYLWLFTKDWPLIYEVYDKSNNLSIHIIGETEVYQKIRSPYKIKLESQIEAKQFYKLLKAMFVLQTELPDYFKFKTNINKSGEIEFSLEDRKIEYANIVDWVNEEYNIGEKKQKIAQKLIAENNEKLKNLKIEIAKQEIEYLAKEKQISTFLECKKTFFGKFKYYFKYSKKNNKSKIKNNNKQKSEEKNEEKILDEPIENVKRKKKQNYTIEELVELYKIIALQENQLKNLLMDINSLKLKNKNMQKKIENATAFIEEIDSHKKSIFEFWKYSNKDEMATLPEGETEEINIIKKITKTFDYEEDLEDFGKKMDKIQRKNLNKEETDSIYITTTKNLEILNKIRTNECVPKDIENLLKELKKEAIEEKTLMEGEEFDVFGGIIQDGRISKIKNKTHRELAKDKFKILDISKNTKQIGFKLSLENIISIIKEALNKVVVPESLPVYKAIVEDKLDDRKINVFNINPEKEIEEAIKGEKNKINFYKINLKEGANAISYANCIFYDNQNKTLPVGQDLSTKILVDTTKLNLKLKEKSIFKIVNFEDETDEFSKISIKTVNVFEFDSEIKQEENKVEKI